MTRRIPVAAHDTFRSFDSRNFRLFFGGQIVSQAGTWMQSVAIVWVVLDLTGSGFALGLVTAAEFLPILLLGAWAGVVADRVDHHRMMLATQTAFLALATTLAVLVLTGHATVPGLFALVAGLRHDQRLRQPGPPIARHRARPAGPRPQRRRAQQRPHDRVPGRRPRVGRGPHRRARRRRRLRPQRRHLPGRARRPRADGPVTVPALARVARARGRLRDGLRSSAAPPSCGCRSS